MTASVLGQRGLRGRVAPEHTSFARNLNDLEGKRVQGGGSAGVSSQLPMGS